MSKRNPDDRPSVDISGPIRAAQVGGKWYVVGGDVLIPARDQAEANTLVSELTPQEKES